MTNIKHIFEHDRYHLVMLLAVFGYALFSIPFPAMGNFCRALLLAGSLGMFFFHRKTLFKDPMIIVLGLSIGIALISWINSQFVIPHSAKDFPEFDRLARLFIFLPMAYWLRGKPRAIFLLFALFAIDFILGMFVKSNFISDLLRGLEDGYRPDFNIKNAQYTSMFSGFFFILSFFLIYKVINLSKDVKSKSLYLVGSFIILAFFFIITMVSQSRMVFLGFIMIIITFPLLHKIAYGSTSIKKTILFYVIASLLLVLLGFLLYPYLDQRFSYGETHTIYKVLHLDFTNIPMSSAGIRINSWVEASKWIVLHPLVGVGIHGPGEVIINSHLFQSRIDEDYATILGLRHLHSFYMDTLVSYGVIGLFILLSMYFFVVRSLLKLKNVLPDSSFIILLALCTVVYWLTINGFESFNFRTYGVLTHNVFMAGLYSFAFSRRLFPPKETSELSS